MSLQQSEIGLSVDEKIELSQLEETIDRGLRAFHEAGRALSVVRDKRLYRETYGTFEDYCSDRWNISRRHAYRLIEAAEVFENLRPIGLILPINESQCRVLAQLPPEQQVEKWNKAVEESGGGQPSAAAIHRVVHEESQVIAVESTSDPIDFDPPQTIAFTVPQVPSFLPVVEPEIDEDQPLKNYQKVELVSKPVKIETPALPKKNFLCITADPPWKYELRADDETHRNRIPYPPMELEEIIALPIPELCDRSGAVMWLWTTNNHMPDACKCLQHWGFELKTILTWVKVTQKGTTHIGAGHWLRSATEHCLLATKGSPNSFRHLGTLFNESTVLYAPRREHSRKPDEFYELVEKLCPDVSKLELFARQTRPGWEAWGNETTKFDEDEAEINCAG